MVAVDAHGLVTDSSAAGFLQLVRESGPLTRADLVARTGLPRSTVVARLAPLLDAGFVVQDSAAPSTGGRPAETFAFNPGARLVVAVDVGATHTAVALTDLNGHVLASRECAIEVSAGPEVVLGQIMKDARALVPRSKARRAKVAGIGVGLPGPVEHARGRAVRPPIMPGWDGFDVGAFLAPLGWPVLVDNDVNLMALGERAAHWSGVADFLFVKVATGIGAGIIAGGMLQRGADGTAGDIGHLPVASGLSGFGSGVPVRCACGNVGCLEAVASARALVRELDSAGALVSGTRGLIDAVAAGDTAAVHAVRQAGRDIGEALASCVNLLNPSVVVVGGALAQTGEVLLAGIREVVHTRSSPLAASRVRIELSRAAGSAAVLGAAEMVARHVLAKV
ncbi:ROK family transcriptional regulator [Haematomicrobium sanguinis]|uniref:ROK family transcriptional regulator n=1 Tax=Haematomicrobium sanguinis TaxID=479106 RepID=UPI00146FA851|nr:ROK family transcriptional regulator [Haematomicrobium sanguinis]